MARDKYCLFNSKLFKTPDLLGAIIRPNDCYITAESILARYGLPLKHDLIIREKLPESLVNVNHYKDYLSEYITLATTDSNNNIQIAKKKFIYSKIPKSLFFGYSRVMSLAFDYVYLEAEPEKALLDYLYLRRPAYIENMELNRIKGFDEEKFQIYSEKYPVWVQEYDFDP
jgi:hypothetical protein